MAYKYTAFLNQQNMRLAVIQPGTTEDDISISLEPDRLDSEYPPPYEALSYVWGSEDDPQPIRIKIENDGLAALHVTQNLFTALKHLRYVDKPRCMWIDAICINQSDIPERDQSVALMGEIYRLAYRTVVWLGPEENESNHAIEVMDFLGSQVEEVDDWSEPNMKPSRTCQDLGVADVKIPLACNARDLCSIYHILCRPWFERLWVRQEITLANSKAMVMCGSVAMPWEAFRRAWFCISWKEAAAFQFSGELRSRLEHLKGFLFQPRYVPVLALRSLFGTSKCKDPRDRIYAILNFVRPSSHMRISPDYTKTAEQVYEEVASRFISTRRSLSILRECTLRDEEGMSAPSWVPDWSTEGRVGNILGKFFACGQLVTDCRTPDSGVLTATGISFGVINYRYDSSITLRSSLGEIWTAIREIAPSEAAGQQPYIGGGTVLEAYTRVLNGDSFSETMQPPNTALPSLGVCVEIMKQLTHSSLTDLGEAIYTTGIGRKFCESVAGKLTDGGHVFTTSTGYVVLAKSPAKAGDVVHVILGCEAPMLLRPVDDKRYQVVCDCFVPGLSHGEAFLGLLPPYVRHAWTEKGHFPVFVDSRTELITREDPRLASLPVELKGFRERLMSDAWAELFVDEELLKAISVDAVSLQLV